MMVRSLTALDEFMLPLETALVVNIFPTRLLLIIILIADISNSCNIEIIKPSLLLHHNVSACPCWLVVEHHSFDKAILRAHVDRIPKFVH